MPNVIRKITYAKKAGESWGTEVELETARMQEVVIGWGSQKDAASFLISKGDTYFEPDNQNMDDTSDPPYFEEEGLVRFYVAKDVSVPHTFTTDDLLFEGTVDNATQTLNESGNEVNVSTFNFYEVFFDVETPYYEENLNCIEHARELLNILRKSGTIITWDDNNPTLKKDGATSFPKKPLALDYTPAFVILEKLLGEEFTEDGQYYWYLSKDSNGQRKLSIRPKDDTLSGTIDESLPIQNIDIDKGKDGVINYVIYNDFTYDASSIGKYGWKTHFLIEETGQIFAALHVEETNENSGSFTFDSNGNLTSNFPGSYPYTFHFDSSISVSNNSDFNEELRIEALRQGFEIADAFIKQTAKTQYIVNVSLPYRNDLIVGGLYSFDLSRIRTFDKQLRLKQITYTLNGITASFDQDTKDRE
mgnify:CR=1 FL=1